MSFTKEILKIVKKYHPETKQDLGVLTNQLIQICCAFAFEYLGEDLGKKDLINQINACYNHAKKGEKL